MQFTFVGTQKETCDTPNITLSFRPTTPDICPYIKLVFRGKYRGKPQAPVPFEHTLYVN